MLKKICFVVSAEITVTAFLIEHLQMLSQFFEITLVLNTNNVDFLRSYHLTNVNVIAIKINRNISLLQDIKALFKLITIFRHGQFDVIHSLTPKAGFLAMISAKCCNVHFRFHCFTGQVWVTKQGFSRYYLKILDKLLYLCTTDVIVDSHSQRQFLMKEGVISSNNSYVLGSGSISGVNVKRFQENTRTKFEVRKRLTIDNDAFVFLFMGRLNKDKGVVDLAKAFEMLKSNNACLIVVGSDEESLRGEMLSLMPSKASNVVFVDHTQHPEEFMMASNVLCLPSYREGFGTVIIEAAATGIPTIASNIYGISDAVVDNQTGILHACGNVNSLLNAMNYCIENPERVREMGMLARERAVNLFDSELLSKAWLEFYLEKVFENEANV